MTAKWLQCDSTARDVKSFELIFPVIYAGGSCFCQYYTMTFLNNFKPLERIVFQKLQKLQHHGI